MAFQELSLAHDKIKKLRENSQYFDECCSNLNNYKSNNSKFRSKCPISCSLDIFGDKWSLLIIRDMVIEQKKTFKDFFSSNEKIASNILTSRLKSLEKIGIISKNSALNNKKTNIYKLTDSGLSLIPTLVVV